jgi:hypothetical protein
MPQGTRLIATNRQREAVVAEVERFLRGRPLMFQIDPDTMSVIA